MKEIYELAKKLFPINRSITGDGVRKTLNILNEVYPLEIKSVPTGYKAFDWEVPEEWEIREAYIEYENGEKILNFKDNNLHIMGYSESIDKIVDLKELQKYLYSLPNQPDAIPYVTSYYKKKIGFCITHNKRKNLKEGNYHIFIDSTHKKGVLNYGEIIIPGKSKKEIFLSTYICHPSMANNEVSGPSLTIFLAKYISSLKNRKYTYRIIFIPETIGSLVYLSKNLNDMKKNIIAGFNISCVGDDRTYSYIASKYENTLADKIVKNVLKFHYPNYKKYSFLQRGSDERQYNAPGIDLPVCGISRSKFGEYPEYHTSKDNLNLISEEGFRGSFTLMKKIINTIENNNYYKVNCLGEPQLGKRGLYPTDSYKGSVGKEVKTMMDFIAYCDGKNDLIDISNLINVSVCDLIKIKKLLLENNLISEIK